MSGWRPCLARAPVLCAALILAGLLTGQAPRVFAETSGATSPAAPSENAPYFRARERVSLYAGPGRETGPAQGTGVVGIGYFGPSDPNHPEWGDCWIGASLAVEAAGREKGRPYRLIPVWSENPWGSGVSRLSRLIYDGTIWAVIGGVDGPSTHLAEQVAAKARIALISPTCSDKTINLANVPWMFACLPGDHLQTPPLARAIDAHLKTHNPAAVSRSAGLTLIATNDHDPRLFAKELRGSLSALRRAPDFGFEVDSDGLDVAVVGASVSASSPTAVAICANTSDTIRLIQALRATGWDGALFTTAVAGRHDFVPRAGAAAEGVVFPWPVSPPTDAAGQQAFRDFSDRFQRQTGHGPDWTAIHGYDAVRVTIAAIEQAGLNRVAIGDALRALSPSDGLSGAIHWDPLGANTRPVTLGVIRNGQPVHFR